MYEEFSFESNPQFIFHDSPGFEAGGEQELQDVLSFLQEKAKANEVKDQIHAIWCVLSFLDLAQLTLRSGFVSLRMYVARYWDWSRGSSMSNVAGMVRSFRISKFFIVTDQRQFRLWRSSRNSTISSRRFMIGTKKTRRIDKSLVLPWRRSSRSRLRVMSFHLAHMCDLNVCLFSFSDRSWDLQHVQLSTRTKVIIRSKLGN